MATRSPTEPFLVRPGQGAAIGAIAIGLSSVWLFPLLTGGIGLFLVAMAWLRGERRAVWIIPLVVGCAALGLFLETLPRSFFT